MNLNTLPRLYRTLQPLRRSQLAWRAWYALRHKSGLGAVMSAPAAVEILPSTWIDAVPRVHGSDALATYLTLQHGEITLLNETRPLGTEPIDWRLAQSSGRLWTLTLHSQAWIYDLAKIAAGSGPEAPRAATLLQRYLSDWLVACSIEHSGARMLAWHAYVVATRLGWWVRTYGCLGPERFKAFGDLHTHFVESLWQQAQFLSEHVEWDLRGNHLIRDALGLAWAGRFFAGPQARRWTERATEIAVAQAKEQILSDGAHFERSPMYHVHVMEDLATLALLLDNEKTRAELRGTLSRMSDYLRWMRHPDGRVPLFNDGAFNGSPPPNEMLAYTEWLERAAEVSDVASILNPADPLGQPRGARFFRDAGVAVFHGERFTVFLDAGEVAVPYQPAHAHADTLTLECSFDGARLFVDPGTYDYDPGERRRYDRSTAAHNTVCIDGKDSSELWHIFRVGRRALPSVHRIAASDSRLELTASHDGYRHLPGAPVHQRRLSVSNNGPLTIMDTISGDASTRSHHIQGGWLLAPEWAAQPVANGWILTHREQPGSKVRVHLASDVDPDLTLSITEAPYHPEYGVELRTVRLAWNWTGRLPLRITTAVGSI